MDEAGWSMDRRSNSGRRAVAAYVPHRLVGYRRGEVAEALGDGSASSVAKAERRVEGDAKLLRRAKKASRPAEAAEE